MGLKAHFEFIYRFFFAFFLANQHTNAVHHDKNSWVQHAAQ
jgi:hypothetical protein